MRAPPRQRPDRDPRDDGTQHDLPPGEFLQAGEKRSPPLLGKIIAGPPSAVPVPHARQNSRPGPLPQSLYEAGRGSDAALDGGGGEEPGQLMRGLLGGVIGYTWTSSRGCTATPLSVVPGLTKST